MRGEIKRLHQELGKTMIYVTHDQIEAMTMADRIVLMRDGRIEQQGAPLDLYERPATRYVAGFLGSPPMNFVDAAVTADDGVPGMLLADGTVLPLPPARAEGLGARRDQPVVLGVRPEHISRAHRGRSASRRGALHRARIDLVLPTGARTYATFTLGGAAGGGGTEGARRLAARRARGARHRHEPRRAHRSVNGARLSKVRS